MEGSVSFRGGSVAGSRFVAAVVFALIFVLVGCSDLGTTVQRNGYRELERLGQTEARVPIGRLVGITDGVVCLILGELGEVHFSDAVPASLRAHILDEVSQGQHRHMQADVYVFNRAGILAERLTAHLRNEVLYISTPDDRADLDVCLGPNDTVFIQRGTLVKMALIYSLVDSDD